MACMADVESEMREVHWRRAVWGEGCHLRPVSRGTEWVAEQISPLIAEPVYIATAARGMDTEVNWCGS